jgi:uncharacterized protein (TIGR04255 family)
MRTHRSKSSREGRRSFRRRRVFLEPDAVSASASIVQVMESSPSLPLGLPEVGRTLLRSAPLEAVVAEVRFVSSIEELTVQIAEAVRDAVQPRVAEVLTTIAPASQQSIEFTAGNEQAPRLQILGRGFGIASADGSVQVTILPGVVTLQLNRYERWSVSLKPPLEALAHAVKELLNASLVQRIGLRFVNRFQEPDCTSPPDWRGRIDPSLLGPLDNEVFGPLVSGAQQVIELGSGPGHGALLRHGPSSVQGSDLVDYLLDIDVFDQVAGAYDPVSILERAELLNRSMMSLFRACVTDSYFKSLEGVDDGN